MARTRLVVWVVIAVLAVAGGSCPWAAESAAPTGGGAVEIQAATEASSISALSDTEKRQLEILIVQLQRPNARRAKQRIISLGAKAVPDLLAALDEEKLVLTQQLIEVLGRIGDERALPHLTSFIQHPNHWYRCAAVYAIGQIGGKESTPILIDCLKDPNCRVCEIALESLVAIDDSRAIPGLIDCLRSPDRELVRIAAKGLAAFTKGAPDYGTDWTSWQLWHETETALQSQGNGHGKTE